MSRIDQRNSRTYAFSLKIFPEPRQQVRMQIKIEKDNLKLSFVQCEFFSSLFHKSRFAYEVENQSILLQQVPVDQKSKEKHRNIPKLLTSWECSI